MDICPLPDQHTLTEHFELNMQLTDQKKRIKKKHADIDSKLMTLS